MKAVVRAKSELIVQEVDTPTPSKNDVLVKVHAATVTSGDIFMHKVPRIAFLAISLLVGHLVRMPGIRVY